MEVPDLSVVRTELHLPPDVAEENEKRKREEEAERRRAHLVEADRRRRHGGEKRTDICIGICRDCSKQRQLWLPARLCSGCLEKTAREKGLIG